MAANIVNCDKCHQPIDGLYHPNRFENDCHDCFYHTTCLYQFYHGHGRTPDLMEGTSDERGFVCECGDIIPAGKTFQQRLKLLRLVGQQLAEETQRLFTNQTDRMIKARIKMLNKIISDLVRQDI